MNVRHLRSVPITADSDHDVKRLAGWSIRENAATAAAATVVLRHADGSAGATGTLIAIVELGADGSDSFTYGETAHLSVPHGDGVHVEVEAGTVEGVLYEAV